MKENQTRSFNISKLLLKLDFEKLQKAVWSIAIFDLFIGFMHLLLPEYQWGQGRSSYFFMSNQISFASWFQVAQLTLLAFFASIAFFKEGHEEMKQIRSTRWIWILSAVLLLLISFAELSGIVMRMEFLGIPEPNIYQTIFSALFNLFIVSCLLMLLYQRVLLTTHGQQWFWLSAILIGLTIILRPLGYYVQVAENLWFSYFIEQALLLGTTFLLGTVGHYIFSEKRETQRKSETHPPALFDVKNKRSLRKIYAAIGLISFSFLVFEILLIRTATIFSDYLTASTFIAIALLGGGVGAFIGYFQAKKKPRESILLFTTLLPFSIIFALSVTATMMSTPLIASILIMLPFILIGAINAIIFTHSSSHMIYFFNLMGAGAGALAVNPLLKYLLEENTSIFLGGVAASALGLFASALLTETSLRKWWIGGSLAGVYLFIILGAMNFHNGTLNLIALKLERNYPEVDVLYSASSYTARFDVVRRTDDANTLKTYENGQVTDTLRDLPKEFHIIDPRLPNNWKDDPAIVVIGLSGDGVTKSARYLSNDVTGIEINPNVVELQSNELAQYNAHSYEGINVVVLDGRSFFQQATRKYDIITLLNTHFSRGSVNGRSPSTEYLYSVEAFSDYFEHLNDDGIISIEDPADSANREPPIWKMLHTIRESLIQNGYEEPEKHFFVFHWSWTKGNTYTQVFVKKTPYTEEEIVRLQAYLDDINHSREIEAKLGHQVTPFSTVATALYTPYQQNNFIITQIIRGEADPLLMERYNIQAVTDNQPFLFDTDSAHLPIKDAFTRVGLVVLLTILPFVIYLFLKNPIDPKAVFSPLMIVSLTGLGFLMVEIILLQRFAIFLGTPVAALICVFAALLISSGLGSFYSKTWRNEDVYRAIFGIGLVLLFHWFVVPAIFSAGASLPLWSKFIISILLIAPLGFLIGIPFPYALRASKEISAPAVAILYGINGTFSALAVPLTFNLNTRWGFPVSYGIGLLLYILVGLLLYAMEKENRFARTLNWVALISILLTSMSPWFPTPQSDTPENPRVYALNYGTSYLEDDIVFYNYDTGDIRSGWQFWLITTPERNILVDTGFYDPGKIDRWDIFNYTHPHDLLAQLDLSPADITDVILTHGHWDHVGLLNSYTNATVWLQTKELEAMQTAVDPQTPYRKGVYWKDVATLIQARSESRLELLDGSSEIYPGVKIYQAPGHTLGAQFVSIDTADGAVVLAGDNAYNYRNILARHSIGSTVDRYYSDAAVAQMREIAASPFLIIPGHDYRILNDFPQVADNIVEIKFK